MSATVESDGKSLKVSIRSKKKFSNDALRYAAEFLPVVSLLLSLILLVKDHDDNEPGTLFYLNSFCAIAYELLEAYLQISNAEDAWSNSHVHYAIVAAAFCVAKLHMLIYEAIHFILMVKASLKTAAIELKPFSADAAKQCEELSKKLGKNVYVKRLIAALEIIIVPWLFLISLIYANGSWLIAWVVYCVLFALYQLVNSSEHKWCYQNVGANLRKLANDNAQSFGKQLNQGLDALKEVERMARKLYPKALIKISTD